MKITKKKTLPPNESFIAAFCKLFKCKPDDIDLQTSAESEHALVIYQDKGYKVSTREALRNDIEYQLSDKNFVHLIDLDCWTEVTGPSVDLKKVIPKLIPKLEDIEQACLLNVALNLNHFADAGDEVFWETLEQIDEVGDVLAYAMMSTREAYRGDGFIDDLTDHQIMNGDTVYNMLQDGIFETIYLNLDKGRVQTFYIYSSDAAFN